MHKNLAPTVLGSIMLTHQQVWTALDRLAARAGLTPSGLAKKAGLDPTTFNKSKRITPEGRARWPSTESIAKSLAAAGASIETLIELIEDRARPTGQPIPLIGFAQAGTGGYFDDAGFPVGKGWDQVAFPAVADENSYALKIAGDSMEPAFRDGTVIIVSPAATVRKGDRVVVKTKDGEMIVKELKRRTAKSVELLSINPALKERTLPVRDVMWMARILWASQKPIIPPFGPGHRSPRHATR